MDTSEEFTATRELCEETGVLVDPDRLIYLYEEKNIAKYTKNTKGATQTINTHTISNDITFLALEWNDSKIKKETKEGTGSWVTKEQLLAGSFARYNDEVLKAYQHYIGGRQTRIDEIEMAVFRNNCT
jgi:8-oxo-dGTP pyrophosphatase MutT (NUDIX family)